MAQAQSRTRKTEQRNKKVKHGRLSTLNLFIAASVRDVGADLFFVGALAIPVCLVLSRACGSLGGLPSGLIK